ncbi:MAG: hypothetical protein AAGC85_12835, partial [Bacteroidota bacterium]
MYLLTIMPFNTKAITLLFSNRNGLVSVLRRFTQDYSPCGKLLYILGFSFLWALVVAPSVSLGQNIWLEAECATVGENLEVLDHEGASKSQAILMKGDTQANSPSNDPKDRIVFEIDVAESGTYQMFSRVAAQDATANSFWVKANGGNWIHWENIGQNSFEPNVGSTTRASKVPIIPGY